MKKGWLKDIPPTSPSGIVLLALAFLAELIGPIPLVGLVFKAFFYVALIAIAKPSLKSLIIPVIIEQIPIVNFFPTILLKMFF